MKNNLSILLLLVLLASGCTQDEMLTNQSAPIRSPKFTASIEGNESRTYIEKGKLLRWTAGDQISLFVANTLNRQYQFEGKTGDNSGTFSIVNSPFGTGNYLDRHYAVYPYAKDITITDDTDETIHITATLPGEQSYAENSFGPGANTMVAVTQSKDDTFLNFKNVGGYLKLKLYGNDVTVKSIVLKGNSNEKIAGKATITPVYDKNPSISMADDATETITLNCGEGVKIGTTAEEATEFWMVVPPVTFDEGFTVTVTDMDGGVCIQSTSKEIVIDRNVIHPMEAFKVEIESIPNNQIWYASSNGDVVTPYKTDVFGANITSNVYNGDKGIITFDKDVTTIGEEAFIECSSLTSIIIPNSVTSIGEYAFRQCTSLSDITIPNSVKSIALEAFSYCNSLLSITIPKSVTNMNRTIFDCSYNLSSIIIESGNPVYDSRENCNAIIETASNTLINGCKNTVIPNTVTSIGSYAFFGSFSLTNITIPNSVTSIGNHAFRNCSSLTSIAIPNSVTKIGEGAFANCSSLSSIVVDSSNPVYDSRENCNAIIETASNTLISGCKSTVIPNTVTTIGSQAFVCQSLTSITMPNSVTSISNHGFYFCTSLTDITIPSSVTSIGDFAFSYCSSLTRLNVKSTTPSTLGGEVFANGNTDLKIYVPAGSLEAYKAADNWKDLNLNEEKIPNNQIWYTSSDDNVVTPYNTDVFGANIVSNSYEDGKGIMTFDGDVTVIGNNAFDVCRSLTSAIIPNSVIVIGEDAFVDCSSLTKVTIPNSVTTLGGGAFYGCSSLTDITIPDGVTTIGPSTFGMCRSLTSITIPSGVTEIDGFSFYGCTSLTSITIPSNVTKIGYGAFPYCKLTSIVVEQGNPVYDSRENCNAIIETQTNILIQGCQNTVIPNSVTAIRTNSFYGCTSLTNITIPSGVTEIGKNVFYGCSSLDKVDVKATTPPLIYSNTFSSNNNSTEFHVPTGSIDAYKAAEFWKDLNLISNGQ